MVIKTKTRSQNKSIGLVAIVNVVNAVVGIVQAFIVGRLFGTTQSIEVFFAASAIFASVNKLLQAGQIAEIFTPIYHQMKKSDGAEAAFKLQAVLLNWISFITFSVTLLLFFGAGFFIPLTVPGFSPTNIATCVAMFQLLVPIIAIEILQFLLATLLINEKRFVSREITQAFAGLAGLLVIVSMSGRFGAWSMIGALWTMGVLKVVIFYMLLLRIGYRHSFHLRHDSFSILDIFKKLPTVFGYVSVSQLYVLVLTAGLSTLPQGYLAVYNYAVRLYSKVSGILVRPVSTVFFSHFSSAVAEGDARIQKQITTGALRMILLLTTVTCVLAIAVGLPALRALWLSPVFPESRIWLTYVTFCSFCFIPVSSGLGLIFRKINMAHQFTHSQYFILIANQIINTVFAYYIIPAWGLSGVITLMLGSAVLITFSSGCLLNWKRPESLSLYDRKTLVQCATLFAVGVFPLLMLQHGTNFYHWLPNSRLGHLAAATILGTAVVILMVFTAHFLKVAELRSGINMAQRKLKGLLGTS